MLLRAEGLMKDYLRDLKDRNHFQAVQTTDLTLEPGTLTVVMGRSGSGKTTLLHLLAGLLTPSAGRVLCDDTDLYTLPDAARARFRNEHIGVIPQGQTALASLTVRENVLLPLSLYRKAEEAELARCDALLERFGIAALRDEAPRRLSGGELRRVAVARALVGRPDLLLADEPTGDLDDENTALVLQALRDAAREGAAVLLVTHEPDAARWGDRLLRMDGGRLTEET